MRVSSRGVVGPSCSLRVSVSVESRWPNLQWRAALCAPLQLTRHFWRTWLRGLSHPGGFDSSNAKLSDCTQDRLHGADARRLGEQGGSRFRPVSPVASTISAPHPVARAVTISNDLLQSSPIRRIEVKGRCHRVSSRSPRYGTHQRPMTDLRDLENRPSVPEHYFATQSRSERRKRWDLFYERGRAAERPPQPQPAWGSS
jgi:hypothetical protein